MKALLLLLALAAPSWLDDPNPAPWNTPGMELPAAPQPELPFDPRVTARERSPETPEEEALVAGGWRLHAAAQTGWGVRVVQATAFYDGMGRPLQYQAFVFVDGAFAGVLSPHLMNSRTDAALNTLALYGPDTLTATFRRYTEADPLCCPSGSTTVTYRIDRTEAGPVVVPATAPRPPVPQVSELAPSRAPEGESRDLEGGTAPPLSP